MQAVVAELEKHGALPGSQSDVLVNLKVAGKFVKSKLRTELGLPRDHLEAWGTIDAKKRSSSRACWRTWQARLGFVWTAVPATGVP